MNYFYRTVSLYIYDELRILLLKLKFNKAREVTKLSGKYNHVFSNIVIIFDLTRRPPIFGLKQLIQYYCFLSLNLFIIPTLVIVGDLEILHRGTWDEITFVTKIFQL